MIYFSQHPKKEKSEQDFSKNKSENYINLLEG